MLANSIITGLLEFKDGNAQIEAAFWNSGDVKKWFDDLSSDAECDYHRLSFRSFSFFLGELTVFCSYTLCVFHYAPKGDDPWPQVAPSAPPMP